MEAANLFANDKHFFLFENKYSKGAILLGISFACCSIWYLLYAFPQKQTKAAQVVFSLYTMGCDRQIPPDKVPAKKVPAKNVARQQYNKLHHVCAPHFFYL
jgi:hypothetical protein